MSIPFWLIAIVVGVVAGATTSLMGGSAVMIVKAFSRSGFSLSGLLKGMVITAFSSTIGCVARGCRDFPLGAVCTVVLCRAPPLFSFPA